MADYTIDKANAEQDAWVFPATLTDPASYASEWASRVTARYFGQPVLEELLALIYSRVSSKAYAKLWTCIAGLNVGDPVYVSATDTVTLALATTAATARVAGFVRYKPSTTTCYIEHFQLKTGLSGLTSGNAVYLSNTGTFSASAGTIAKTLGVATDTDEAVVAATSNPFVDSDTLDGYHASSFQLSLTNPVTGTGTSGKIAKLTGTSTIGDSVITESSGKIGIGEASPGTLLDIASADPYLTIHNTTEEDAAGGREGKLIFKGEQSGGELTTLGEIEFSHDGAADDEKGKLIIRLNDGNDGASPTTRLTLQADGGLLLATIKSGATQGAAGAAAGELWKTASHATLPDNTVMIGV